MSVALLIITHESVGEILLDTAVKTLADNPMPSHCISVTNDCDPRDLEQQAKTAIDDLDQGDGVLVLTDMYGSTPSNVSCALLGLKNVAVVSGINLPMLLRVLNYPALSLVELVEKALSGGREGIMDCRSHNF
jgi:PTS system mannose-specific IIA component